MDEKRKIQDEKAAAVLEAYKKGFRHGLQCFAWWDGGVQTVGTCGTKLHDAIEGMEKLYNYSPPRI